MSAVYPLDTPSRVLRRVQLLEDMELPSLPSFQHDINYDSGMSSSGGDTSHEDVYSQNGEEIEAVSIPF